METCVRGFSYMPESKSNVNLQYIENGELERAWKINRRQRLKDQEQRIWEDFVKEQDMVQKAYAEDPYQFLHKLPEVCLKELMETELCNMKKETQGATVVDQPNQGEGDHPTEKQIHSVTFAEVNESPSSPNLAMFQIFDDDTELNHSGGEEDQLESPSTVRERSAADDPASPPMSPCTVENRPAAPKSSENVSNVIESSIYCARVKDIRLKLSEEMIAIMASLDIQDVMSVDRQEVARRCRRAAEFCGRFNRVYMYQLQRQIHNLKRHVSKSLPLAQHTQFQSQMLRVVSLHQNMLQALQVFHKSFPATSCLRECGRALSALCGAVRGGSALCGAVPVPGDLGATGDLYNDELLQTCDKLDCAINKYTARVADFLSASAANTVDMVVPPSTSSPRTKKSKKVVTSTKTAAKCCSNKGTDARLSMYSLDTQRLAQSKAGSRDSHSSGTSKRRVMLSSVTTKTQSDKDKASKNSARRPLMRGPQSGSVRLRSAAARRDGDVSTMVEAVPGCESSHMLASPRPRAPSPAPRSPRARTSRHHSPLQSPRNTRKLPLLKHRTLSPKVHKSRCASPKNQYSKAPAKTTFRTEIPSTITTVRTPVAPVTKIQCAKKTPRSPETSPNRSGKSTDRSGNFEKSTDRSGMSTDRSRNIEKSIERSGKSTDRPRTDKNTSRSKENDRGYGFGVSSNDRECDDCKGTKIYKNVGRGKVDKDVDFVQLENLNPTIDTDGSNGLKKDVSGKVVRPGHIGNPGKEDNTGREFCGVKELTDNDDDYSRRYAKEVDEENAFLSENGINMILEETIQKQSPRQVPVKSRNPEKYRLSFNIPENIASRMFQYRTKFVQHMLTSPLYANSAVGKPWEMIGGVSDKIIDALLTSIAKEMEINHVLRELYKSETN